MKRILILIFLLNFLSVFAGDNVRVKGHKLILLPFVSGIWQRSFFGEADIGHVYNIHYVNRHFERSIVAYSKLGAEFNLNFPKGIPSDKHELYAPKFSSEIDLSLLCVRVNIEDYTEPGVNKFYFTPEAGLTLAGFITVCAGYNKPISNSGFAEIKPVSISASLMLPFKLSGSTKYK